MGFSSAELAACEQLVRLALGEDLGQAGDLTSAALIPPELQGQAAVVARSAGVIAGLPAAQLVCRLVDPRLECADQLADGAAVTPGTVLAVIRGPMRSILTAERTALNFLQRLSGVATLTAQHVETIKGLRCQVLDTRKTTPGWRLLEKYAVRMGGGHNHRMGLHDGVLIKDNHLAALGADKEVVATAVGLARAKYAFSVPLEVEVDNLDQFDIALAASPDIILLDNMTPQQIREAVRRRDTLAPRVQLEASGGVTLATLRSVAETGVDRISVGALTHSAKALDIALDYLH
jgi:nicotinate-nucleotide pyrophosphorylase (carboxylating)